MSVHEEVVHYVPLLKASSSGYVLAPALIPGEFDAQGDMVDEAEVESAMHSFVANGRTIDLMHQEILGANDVIVVENYIARERTVINGTPVKKGSWLIGLQLSKRLREQVASGKISGLSIKGRGVRTPVD